MILQSLTVDAAEFSARTGWDAKPEGLCRGDVCVPAPDVRTESGSLDVAKMADRLRMPLVHDEASCVWALGPATVGGRALATAAAADPLLHDADGNPFRLSTLHGRKVIMVAWASW